MKNVKLLNRICTVSIAEKKSVTYYNNPESRFSSETYLTKLSKRRRPSTESEIERFWEILNE